VGDGAIPPQGRKVRCASCGDSWSQEPEGGVNAPAQATDEIEGPTDGPVDIEVVVDDDAPDPSPYDAIPDRDGEADEEESFAEAALIEPRTGPEAEERAYEEALVAEAASAEPGSARESDWSEPPEPEEQGDDYPVFQASDEPESPRRRWLPVLILLLIVTALSALFWFAAPDEWKSRLGIASHASPLTLVTTHMDRTRLESGNELLTVTGRVINPTGQDQSVPPLTAELRTRAGKVVYRWTIAPPARTLAPGASASFNSAEVNVPPGGEEIRITLGGRAA
jgi:hypothetical protein